MIKSIAQMAKIEAEYSKFMADAKKLLSNGNKSAGTRSRTASKDLAQLLKEWRKITIEESR